MRVCIMLGCRPPQLLSVCGCGTVMGPPARPWGLPATCQTLGPASHVPDPGACQPRARPWGLPATCQTLGPGVGSAGLQVRPVMLPPDEGELVLVGSRHPCVEAQEGVTFVANDCR